MVEQGTHKPLVGGSNPPSATTSTPRRPAGTPGGSYRFLHLRRRRHPIAPSVRRDDRRAGRPSGGASRAPPLYSRDATAHGRRSAHPGGSLVESQVLPERHRDARPRRGHRGAAVHVDLDQHADRRRSATPSSSPTSQAGEVTKVVQQGTTLTVDVKDADRSLHGRRPERPDRRLRRHAAPPPTRGGQPLRDRRSRRSRPPTRRGSGCS